MRYPRRERQGPAPPPARRGEPAYVARRGHLSGSGHRASPPKPADGSGTWPTAAAWGHPVRPEPPVGAAPRVPACDRDKERVAVLNDTFRRGPLRQGFEQTLDGRMRPSGLHAGSGTRSCRKDGARRRSRHRTSLGPSQPPARPPAFERTGPSAAGVAVTRACGRSAARRALPRRVSDTGILPRRSARRRPGRASTGAEPESPGRSNGANGTEAIGRAGRRDRDRRRAASQRTEYPAAGPCRPRPRALVRRGRPGGDGGRSPPRPRAVRPDAGRARRPRTVPADGGRHRISHPGTKGNRAASCPSSRHPESRRYRGPE